MEGVINNQMANWINGELPIERLSGRDQVSVSSSFARFAFLSFE